jgi:hypothetical protein
MKEEIFSHLFSEGHLSLTQWLHSLGDVDIHAENDDAFRVTCTNGHLSVAQWLYRLGNVNIPRE